MAELETKRMRRSTAGLAPNRPKSQVVTVYSITIIESSIPIVPFRNVHCSNIIYAVLLAFLKLNPVVTWRRGAEKFSIKFFPTALGTPPLS